MKFRFCGGLDAPDWILAEVSVMSKMSSVRMMLICRQVLRHLLDEGIDYEKLDLLTTNERLQLEPSDIKAMMSALTFMMRNAAKFDVELDVLDLELQQLGLPADICTAICKELSRKKDELMSHFAYTTLSMPRVKKMDWRVDYVLATSDIKSVQQPSVKMNLQLTKDTPDLDFELSGDKFRALVADLKAARGLMNGL